MTLCATLDFDALANNLATLRALGDGAAQSAQQFIASIKSNAYGHGVLPVGCALSELGADMLATGSPSEALALRDLGLTTPIMLFACAPPRETAELACAGFTTTVVDLAGAHAVSEHVRTATPIYVKVDAGLGRLGIPLAVAVQSIREIAKLPRIQIEGIYTHVPFHAPDTAAWAADKINAFAALLAELRADGIDPPVTQARASGAVLASLSDTCNAVCVGHALFGLTPFSLDASGNDEFGTEQFVKPVLEHMTTKLLSVSEHNQGADIAIARLYNIRRGRRIGVLPVGRGHGMARPVAPNEAAVLIRGKRAPILAVSLEHTTVALDDIPDATPGDDAVIVGQDGALKLSLAEVASWSNEGALQRVLGWSGRAEVTPYPSRPTR